MKKFKLDKKSLVDSIKTGVAITGMSGSTSLGAAVGSGAPADKLIELAVFSIGLGIVFIPSSYIIFKERNVKESVKTKKKNK